MIFIPAPRIVGRGDLIIEIHHILAYLYDAQDSPIGMGYRNSTYPSGTVNTYWFEKNLQGDVIAIYNEGGTKLVSYTYDAWGKVTTTYHNGGASTVAYLMDL